MRNVILFFMLCGAMFFGGCYAVYNANRAEDLSREGSIVFTRPARFTPFFGSYSISDFVEIVYEKAYKNEAGQLVVEVGIRNRGPVSWTNWNMRAPERLTIKTTCNFYNGNRNGSPIVYSTNRREIVINRGETFAYQAVCPAEAFSYQVILGD